MDPFQVYTISLYNHFITKSSDNLCINWDIKWSLLACEMVLKEKLIDSSIHIRVLTFLLEIIKKEEAVLTDNNWMFVVDCVRKGIKRLDGSLELIGELLDFISENLLNLKSLDELLKLLLTCKDYGIKFNDSLVNYLNSLYSYEKILVLDFDEFHFINCSKTDHYRKQHCQRLLVLLDPLKGLKMFPDATEDYWFRLFSISDAELISFMRRILKAEEKRFFKFYNHLISNDLLSVDFFIDQLLTDSVELLELLLDISSLKLRGVTNKHFKNFHTLLLLKLEMSKDSFPFDCKILLNKMEKFLA